MQCEVGDYYEFKNGINKGKDFFGKGTPIVNFKDVFHHRGLTSENLLGRVEANPKELKNYEVKKGDIFFTRTSETIEEIGYPSVMLDEPEDTVFSGFILRGRNKSNSDPLNNLFKKYVFFTSYFRKEMMKKSSMTTRALTTGTNIKEMKFRFPKDITEQNKIGKLLTNLDCMITLEQEKIEKLELLKQAYENKIFDPNFTSKNWSYKKIGDLFEERKIRSAKGELLSVTIENGVVKASEIDRTINASSDRSNYKLVEPNDIAYNSMRMWQGACGASNYEGIVSPAYTVLVPKEDVNSKFFEYYFKSPYMLYQFASFSQGLTSDTWNLKYPIIKDIEIYVPNINEQNQIESFLSTYYGLIKQNQKRIDLYDQVKYCLLNKLFI
nr:restriction endonuclease subunit S [Aerococcus sp. HMSC072A12]